MTGDVDRARVRLRSAESIVVLTGAGVSAESGVPTFRSEQGLWRSHRPEELATPEAFRRDPALVWSWYQWRRRLVAECAPNAGHEALARLALRHDRATLVTQNVDGLHHRAADTEAAALGLDSAEGAYPLEVHGALHRDRCSGCDARTPARGASDPDDDAGPPPCFRCGGLLRPDVVWFGEPLDDAVIGAAQRAASMADVCLVVGTSALVYPAAGIPDITRAAGGEIVEVNVEPTALTRVAAVSVRGPSADVLPDLLSG